MEATLAPSKRKRAKHVKVLKGAEPAPPPAEFIPDIPLPASARSSSMCECQQPTRRGVCGAKWSGMNGRMTRELPDGTSEPVRHVVWEVVKLRLSTTVFDAARWQIIQEDGREVMDIRDIPRGWRLLDEWFHCWLCPDHYARAEEMGWAEWAEEYQWLRASAEADRRWLNSVQEEARAQRDRAWQSPSADSVHKATHMYRIDENGNRVGVMLVEGELDQIFD
jgi:hypothetical protein